VPMSIRGNLVWLTVIGLGGVVIFAVVAFAVLVRVEINGPIYGQIALSKDLVSDYVPPSESLLNVALTCSRMNQTDNPAEIEREITRFQAAKDDLEDTYADYMRRVPEGRLKDMMRGTAYQTAEQYFRIAEQEFIPLVRQGQHEKAREVLVSRMKPVYEQHTAAVDQIVALANEEVKHGEAQAARSVRFYTGVMVAGVLLLLLAGGLVSVRIARAITRHTQALLRSKEALAQSNRALSVVSSCNVALVHATDEKALLDKVCALIVDRTGYRLAWVGYAEHDEAKTVRPVAWGGDGEFLRHVRVSWGENEHGRGSMGQAIREGRPVVIGHLQEHPGFTAWKEIMAERNFESVLAIPLKSGNGVFGALAIYAPAPDSFTAEEVKLIEELGNDLAYGLVSLRARKERAEALAALERARAELEERVRQRTAELTLAKEEAESADRFKSAFLAIMSHELRTPLNSIIGFTGISLQELAGPLNPDQKKQLGMVQKSARHLLDLINDVLDISKIEAGQLEVKPHPFDVRASVQKVAHLLLPQVQRKGLTLRIDVAPEVGTIVNDSRRMEQVLLNLLNNAIKFTESGSVQVQCGVEDGWLVTSVRDSGIGISPQDLNRLFRPFQQLESGLARKHEGTGLGLSISKRLVDLMGGTISVESAPGQGSTFSYRLPIGGSKHS
jgi:signal transduction histidine kinase